MIKRLEIIFDSKFMEEWSSETFENVKYIQFLENFVQIETEGEIIYINVKTILSIWYLKNDWDE